MVNRTATADAKRAAVEQWTADPCGAVVASGELGTADYFRSLIQARADYASWMAEELDYAGTQGLDVLDVGCGQGIDVAQYALAGARAVGIDLTPRHVELARSHALALGLDVTVTQGDAESLPFADASFDRASSNGVLHHTPDIDAALREINRVLRPGGEARIIVYNRNSFHYWLKQVAFEGLIRGKLVNERSMAGVLSASVEYSTIGARPLVRVYTAGRISEMMRLSNFRGIEVHARHFHLSDTPVTYPLRRWSWAQNPRLLDRAGRIGGWYLIARGMKPASS